ncbi:MAG: lectin [Gammaproteobacteria bacterium]|nr:lectin [Gammaproteobacteria bacterium]MCH2669618.1 lectin [Gammaproteobacteria bacterium]|tara:strand:+ start:455 stop:1252 length:798 start_codon:yes stop_codon:yes gene_type:complete
MLKPKFLISFLTLLAASSSGALAQHGMLGGIPMSFFVTSEAIGNGGNLGGLEGADAHCQTLATRVGAGELDWRAYLSTQARAGKPAINARDRIGKGPWHNHDGIMIASSVAHLHGDTLELARMGNNLHKQTGLTEKGAIVPGLYDYLDPRDRDWEYVKTTPYSNRHEVLTGSQPDGRAFPPDIDYTCDNWTSNADPAPELETLGPGIYGGPGRPNAQIGFPDREGGGNGSWNSSHGTRGCSQTALPITHGIGQFYCFGITGDDSQ